MKTKNFSLVDGVSCALPLRLVLLGIIPVSAAPQGEETPDRRCNARISARVPAIGWERDRVFFRALWTPYQQRTLPHPILMNSPRLKTLIRDGKLELSLADALALTLENNLDIVVQRYVIPIAQTDILRSKSGQAVRGFTGALVSQRTKRRRDRRGRHQCRRHGRNRQRGRHYGRRRRRFRRSVGRIRSFRQLRRLAGTA